MADREGVEIRYYTVIYQAIEEIEAALKGMLKPEYEEVELGTRGDPRGLPLVQDRQHRRLHRPVRASSGATPRRACSATGRSWRTTSRSARCKRFKDDATEVREGFECGMTLGGFNNIQVGDIIETLEMREKPRA